MPRYHFNVLDGQDILDVTGTVLHDVAAAKHEAVALSGALLRDTAGDFWGGGEWKMVVTDEAGATLFVLRFTGIDGSDQPVAANA